MTDLFFSLSSSYFLESSSSLENEKLLSLSPPLSFSMLFWSGYFSNTSETLYIDGSLNRVEWKHYQKQKHFQLCDEKGLICLNSSPDFGRVWVLSVCSDWFGGRAVYWKRKGEVMLIQRCSWRDGQYQNQLVFLLDVFQRLFLKVKMHPSFF